MVYLLPRAVHLSTDFRIQAESAAAGPLLKQAFRFVPQTGHMYMAKLTGSSSSSGLKSMAASVEQAMQVPPSRNVTEAEAAEVLNMVKGNSTAAKQGARKLNIVYGYNDRQLQRSLAACLPLHACHCTPATARLPLHACRRSCTDGIYCGLESCSSWIANMINGCCH